MIGKPKASPDVTSEEVSAGFDPHSPIDPSHALVPAVQQVNERRVAHGFWPKIRRVAAKIPFAADAVAVFYCAKDPATPATAKGMMLAGLAYFVLPTDAIPDVLAGIGFTDDAAVIAALMAVVGKHLKPQHREAAQRFMDRLRD